MYRKLSDAWRNSAPENPSPTLGTLGALGGVGGQNPPRIRRGTPPKAPKVPKVADDPNSAPYIENTAKTHLSSNARCAYCDKPNAVSMAAPPVCMRSASARGSTNRSALIHKMRTRCPSPPTAVALLLHRAPMVV